MTSPEKTAETQPVPHMSAEEFRRRGRELIDFIADYMEGGAERYPVLSRTSPGEVVSMLPREAPERGEPWEEILADVERIIMPGLTHWQHPGFFAYFPCANSYPAILGDLLCTGLMVQGMLWQTSPACTEVETRVLDWLGRAIGLPGKFLHDESAGTGGGVIQGTASEAALVAMVAARKRAVDRGADAASLVAYTSEQAHSSIVKAARIIGLADESVRLIQADDALAVRPDLLREAIEQDRRAGLTPFFVCATIGTTSTGAVDPLGPVGEACAESRAWLHVDAAYAGSALVCPEFRWAIEGVERADSFNFNPHKWLLTNFDCSALWVADADTLVAAMSITPEYLRTKPSEEGSVIDYRDWQVPLGRRFRALKLWFVLRHYGLEGLRAHIRHHVRLASRFEELVRSDERFELCAERRFALVCFRYRGTDEQNRSLMEAINASGDFFLTHTVVPVGGPRRLVLRVSVGAPGVREEHVRGLWKAIAREASRL